jgi:hypothetical protein
MKGDWKKIILPPFSYICFVWMVWIQTDTFFQTTAFILFGKNRKRCGLEKKK